LESEVLYDQALVTTFLPMKEEGGFMRSQISKFLTAALVAVGLATGSGAGLAQSGAIYPAPKEPEMTPRLQLGMMNYGAYCAECHGKTGGGSDKGPTFIHRVYNPGHHGDGSFFVAAKRGARAHHWKFGDMKPVKDVTDAQLELIVEYVRAFQKANGLF
jgi:mono/diheme cytochrome c family protein